MTEVTQAGVYLGGKGSWPLATAEQLAGELVDLLAMSCDRIAVAGSIRRRKEYVGDIELLCISKVGQAQGDLFRGATATAFDLDQRILDLIGAGVFTYRLNRRGARNFGVWNKHLVHVATGIGVDVFSTTVKNWGMAFVVRTGSMEFNIKVMGRFKALGMQGHAYGGVSDGNGRMIDCPIEETVFRLLAWRYVWPEDRR